MAVSDPKATLSFIDMDGIKVIGVHPVDAWEGVYLIEIQADGNMVDWISITQPLEGKSKDDWQVPYDEQLVPGTESRWCFFFHYLDKSRPLSSATGPLTLPLETPIPDHLRFMKYESPC